MVAERPPDMTCTCGAELRIGSTSLAAREAEASRFYIAHMPCLHVPAEATAAPREGDGDLVYVAPGLPQAVVDEQITESLAAVGLTPEDFINATQEGMTFRAENGESPDYDSYLSGFMDAIELIRCRS